MAAQSEELFVITTAHLNTGLRGFPAGTCGTSAVNPLEGVSYVGYPIAELVELEPEAVVYLLFRKSLPTESQLAEFSADLKSRRGIPQGTFSILQNLPREGHPMEWLAVGLSYLGMTGRTGSYEEDALNLVAWAPELVAAIYRIRSGWGEPIASDPSLSLVDDFTQMLDVPDADQARLKAILRAFYILHMDHGGGNLSTFAGKAIASAHADIFMSLIGSMAALSGPLHGRANQDCLDFVRKVGTADPDAVEKFVRESLAKKEKIYGFGHAVLRAEDPRATIQYALGEEMCGDDPLFQTARTLRAVAVKVLSEIEKVSNPHPNVDAVSGTLLNACGLKDADYYTVLFGLSRITGIAAQIVDERVHARGGKGIPICRPKYIAENQPKRSIRD